MQRDDTTIQCLSKNEGFKMIDSCIEWLETKIELNKRIIENDIDDFSVFLKNDNQILSEIITLLKTLKLKEVSE